MDLWNTRFLGIPYSPDPGHRPFVGRAEARRDGDLIVKAAVLDDRESERFFGVPLARRGIQPVWLEITNHAREPFRFRQASLDPNYFPPLEAAYVNHFRFMRRIVAFSLLAWYIVPLFILFGWLILPLLVLLSPFKILAARSANQRMNAYFEEHGIGWALIKPGDEVAGFVFTSLDEGTKQFSVRLLGRDGAHEFAYSIPVPGLRVDYGTKQFDALIEAHDAVDCDEDELRRRLEVMPRSTTNRGGTKEGDPLNLATVGDFSTILTGFGARWDETEIISIKSCVKTCKAFLLGDRYRYSPVSALFVEGRSQDFALQRVRQRINERMHLRLWLTPLRFHGKPVWIGQISRDIGVRFTHKTWNLTTHKIDPDVDDARDNVLDDLMEGGRVAQVGYVAGAQAAGRDAPRHNLTGDPYYTDGLRAVAVFSETRTSPTYLSWT
jgi:hypothetical protein